MRRSRIGQAAAHNIVGDDVSNRFNSESGTGNGQNTSTMAIAIPKSMAKKIQIKPESVKLSSFRGKADFGPATAIAPVNYQSFGQALTRVSHQSAIQNSKSKQLEVVPYHEIATNYSAANDGTASSSMMSNPGAVADITANMSYSDLYQHLGSHSKARDALRKRKATTDALNRSSNARMELKHAADTVAKVTSTIHHQNRKANLAKTVQPTKETVSTLNSYNLRKHVRPAIIHRRIRDNESSSEGSSSGESSRPGTSVDEDDHSTFSESNRSKTMYKVRSNQTNTLDTIDDHKSHDLTYFDGTISKLIAKKHRQSVRQAIENAPYSRDLLLVHKGLSVTFFESLPKQERYASLLMELEQLHIAGNHLARLPGTLCMLLTHVTVLDVSQNNLKELPTEISNCKELRKLFIRYNQLIEIPDSCGDLNCLEQLHAGGNDISVLSPRLGKLQFLKSLLLENNQLVNLPLGITGLMSLQTVNLNDNKIETLALLPIKEKAYYADHLDRNGKEEQEKALAMHDQWEQVSDPITDEIFYMNTRTKEVSRIPPKGKDELERNMLIQAGQERIDPTKYVTLDESEEPLRSENDDENDTNYSNETGSNEGLPPGWEQHWDAASGCYYYYKVTTGQTQWEKPTQLSIKPRRLALNLGKTAKSKKTSLKERLVKRRQYLARSGLPEWSYTLDSDSGELQFRNEITGKFSAVGEIPPTLDVLNGWQNLKELYVNCNQLTAIPNSLCMCSHLVTLEANFNKINRLPDEIGKLIKLKNLRLSENRLVCLPDSIGQLSNLEVLFVNGNRLCSLHDKVGSCANLQVLSFSHNLITVIPASIGKLSSTIRELSWGGNPLTVPSKQVLMKGVQHVLYDCRERLQREKHKQDPPKAIRREGVGVAGEHKVIEAEFDKRIETMLKESKHSKVLNMHFLTLTKLPEHFVTAVGSELHEIRLTGNHFENGLPTQLFEVKGVQFLHLVNNKLKGVAGDWENLSSSLVHLDVSENAIETLPTSVSKLRCLEVLILSNNALEKLPTNLGELTNLRDVRVENNRLQYLPQSIGSLLKLERLFLTKNHIATLPESFAKLERLKQLYISQNDLSVLSSTLGSLNSLEILRVAKNRIGSIKDGFCSTTGLGKCLRVLSIQGNAIMELPESFCQMEALTELWYDMNPIRSPPEGLSTRGVVAVMNYIKERGERFVKLKTAMTANGIEFNESAIAPVTTNILEGKTTEYLLPNDRARFDEQVDRYVNANFYDYNQDPSQMVLVLLKLMALRERNFHRKLLNHLLLVIETGSHHELFPPHVFFDDIQQEFGLRHSLVDCYVFRVDSLYSTIPKLIGATKEEKDANHKLAVTGGGPSNTVTELAIKDVLNSNDASSSSSDSTDDNDSYVAYEHGKEIFKPAVSHEDNPSVLSLIHERDLMQVPFEYTKEQVLKAIDRYHGPYGKVGKINVRFYFEGEIEPKGSNKLGAKASRLQNTFSKGVAPAAHDSSLNLQSNSGVVPKVSDDLDELEGLLADIPSENSEESDSSSQVDNIDEASDDEGKDPELGDNPLPAPDHDEQKQKTNDVPDAGSNECKGLKDESSGNTDVIVEDRNHVKGLKKFQHTLQHYSIRTKAIAKAFKLPTREVMISRIKQIAEKSKDVGTGFWHTTKVNVEQVRSGDKTWDDMLREFSAFRKRIWSYGGNKLKDLQGDASHLLGSNILKDEYPFDKRGVVVLSQLLYTDEEASRRKSESKVIDEYIKKLESRMRLWLSSAAGKGRVKVEILRRRNRLNEKLVAVNSLLTRATADLKEALAEQTVFEKRAKAFALKRGYEIHQFDNEREVDQKRVECEKLVAAKQEYLAKLKVESTTIANMYRVSTKVMKRMLEDRLLRRVRAKAKKEILNQLRREALRNNLRRPWDGKHGSAFAEWTKEFLRHRIDKGDSDSESEDDGPSGSALGDIEGKRDNEAEVAAMYDFGFASDDSEDGEGDNDDED